MEKKVSVVLGGHMNVWLVFVYLQLLDILTTLIALNMGGEEMSPAMKGLMLKLGSPLVAMLLAKIIWLVLAYIAWSYYNKRRFLVWVNWFSMALVLWNTSMIILIIKLDKI